MVFIHFRVNYYKIMEFYKNIFNIMRNFNRVELFIYFLMHKHPTNLCNL